MAAEASVRSVVLLLKRLYILCRCVVQWMPLEEFVKQPFIQEDHMFQKIMDICIQRLRKCYCGLTAHNVVSKFDGRQSTLYYNVGEPEDVNCAAA